jgi:hypothetical protein
MRATVPASYLSRRFLRDIQAPAATQSLSFSIKAGGVLECTAVYYVNLRFTIETQTKTWTVQLDTRSPFYQFLTQED